MEDPYKQIISDLGMKPIGGAALLSENQLHGLESVIGAELPTGYRSFLSRHGYSFRPGITYPEYGKPGSNGGCVEVFLGVDPERSYDIQETWEGLHGRLPDHFLPIADSPGGQICLAFSGDDRGKIYWWGFEFIVGAGASPSLIADDFDSFMKSLDVTP